LLLRHPLILAPQTIGPFAHPFHRRVAKMLMDRATAVYARDYLSASFLRELETRSATDEFVDVAFRLPFVPAGKCSGPVRVGINVSGLLYNRGYTGTNELGMMLDYATLTQMLIEHFRAEPNVSVELFAHVSGGGGPDDDGPVIEDLGRRFPGVKVIPRFSSSVAAKSWMSGLDFVVAGRMHACIGAYSAGVPVVPIAYSRKFNGLFGTLNYPYFIDGKTTATEAACSSVVAWFGDRAVLKETLEASRPVIEQRLLRYEDRIGDVLAAIANGAAA
jgi:polysaccharide pyruvyl transferase WcaK-like protein